MKFSLKCLSDFIPVDSFFDKPEVLVQALTHSGLEVDDFVDQRNQFKNIVTAQIESVEKHPQADRLTLCKVSTGKETFSVVCGAKNHKVGDKALLAKPGAIVRGDLKIKKSRIRGIESEGMLASREELGFESEEEGIWILDSSAPVGTDFSRYQSLDDIIFDIEIPPNRADCLSHKGLAREIACLLSLPFSFKDKSLAKKSSLSVKKSISVEVKESSACPRYCGRWIKGVKIKESPAWLKKYLNSVGLKSINNVVDITNFVLWDRGQPLHAFDQDKIENIEVSFSKKGEKFLALDDSEISLTGEELVIRDKKGVLALAGVMGGKDSGITEQSQNIFIESACFAPEKIRRTARRFGMETDSSYRFARGIDISAVLSAMDLACYLIQDLAGGEVSSDFYDIYNEKGSSNKNIEITLMDLSDRLGYLASAKLFEKWMKGLGCELKKTKADHFQVLPPSYRSDLKIKEDLIEEFARLEGYDKVPENLRIFSGTPKDSDTTFLNSQKCIQFLEGKGWHQAIHYSFCDPEYYKDFLKDQFYLEDLTGGVLEKGLKKQKEFLINNPISQQLSLMKTLLTPDLVKTAVHNFRHNNKFGRVFELSPVFYQEEKEYKQKLHLAFALWGEPLDIWKGKKIPNVYHIKSSLDLLFSFFGIKNYTWKKASLPFLHPKQSLVLYWKNQALGFLGSLHPELLLKYKLPLDLATAELYWKAFEQVERKTLKYKAFSSLSVVEKDLSFVIPQELSVEDVRKEIKKSLGSLCEKVEIFDIYEKKGERSVSFKMYLEPEEKSWTDEQLQVFLNQIVEGLNKKFSISLKSGT